jgi:3-deoxy-manno-octulosonate cytidylyltransferase (CMP-KDO synthetase)
LIEAMRGDTKLQMATLATPIHDASQNEDSNVVKVVCAQNGNALYFSRHAIPFVRDSGESSTRLRHLGVYAYELGWLRQMASLAPTPLETQEKLEQLRALEHGVAVRVLTVEDVVSIAIDTPQI